MKDILINKVKNYKFQWQHLTVAFFVLLSLFILSLRSLTVVSFSMSPTLEKGDIVLVDWLSLYIIPPMRGGNIVYVDPRNKEHPYVVKRIVGMPNETVFIKNDLISIVDKNNSTTTFEAGSKLGGTNNGGDFQMLLGKDDYFLMGDNRPGSKDSRQTGTIQPPEMFGRPLFRIYPFSRFGFIF